MYSSRSVRIWLKSDNSASVFNIQCFMPLKADFKCQTVMRKYLLSKINYFASFQVFETKSFNIF